MNEVIFLGDCIFVPENSLRFMIYGKEQLLDLSC